MRVALLSLLCSCAHVQTETPASLPWLHIDSQLTGLAVSREAAETIAVRLQQSKLSCVMATIDCETKTKVAEMQRDLATKRSDQNAWWGAYGLPITLASSVVGLSIGFAIAWMVATSILGGFK